MATQSKRPQIGILNKLYEAIGKGHSIINGMHKGAAQAELEVSRKNWIINGDMQVSQRGNYTSPTAAVNNTFYVDRWKYSYIGTAGANVQVTSDGLKLTVTSGTSGGVEHLQKIEDVSAFDGQTVTISAKVVSNNPNARIAIRENVSTWHTSNAHSGDGTEQTLTLTLKATSSVTDFWFYAGIFSSSHGNVTIATDDYITFDEAKLEIGDTATPFEVEPYAEVLRKCQRYYQRWGDNESGDNYPVISNCHLETATEARGAIIFQTRMRTAPTMSASGSFRVYTTTSLSVSSLGFQSSTPACAPISATCSSGTAGHGGMLQANNDAAAYIAADAEIL